MRDNRRNRSHTKKGPGRYAGRGKMVIVRPLFDDVRIVKDPQQRLAPAIIGGNWQGQEYLTYREHDLATRCTFDVAPEHREVAYNRARQDIINARKAQAAA